MKKGNQKGNQKGDGKCKKECQKCVNFKMTLGSMTLAVIQSIKVDNGFNPNFIQILTRLGELRIKTEAEILYATLEYFQKQGFVKQFAKKYSLTDKATKSKLLKSKFQTKKKKKKPKQRGDDGKRKHIYANGKRVHIK